MSEGQGEIEFEVVTKDEARRLSNGEEASASSPTGAPDVAKPNGHAQGDASVEQADVRALDPDNFPLAGPILDASTGRELTGRCSQCETRLRIRVKGPGTVKVRCPICGHTRRIEI